MASTHSGLIPDGSFNSLDDTERVDEIHAAPLHRSNIPAGSGSVEDRLQSSVTKSNTEKSINVIILTKAFGLLVPSHAWLT